MNPRDRAWIALAAALPHWAMVVAIQAGVLVGGVLPGTPPEWAALRSLPQLQGQAVLVSSGLGLLGYGLASAGPFRWILLPVQLALTILILADQAFYRVFLNHIRPSNFDGGRDLNIAITFSSFRAEADASFLAAAVIGLLGLAGLGWILFRRPAGRPRLGRWMFLAGALALAGIPAWTSGRYFHLQEHPLIALGRDWVSSRPRPRVQPGAAPAAAAVAVSRDARLAALSAAGRRRAGRPNLVLVVMESVGAQNLLGEDGLPSPVWAPTLARLASGGVTFPNVYVPFPGTTRALVSLHTGGRYLAEGSQWELARGYRGPLLGRALQSRGYATGLFSSERLDGEGSDVFLKQGGYDHFQEPSLDTGAHLPQNVLNSWGAREEFTVRLMGQWLDEVSSAGKPFYLEYMTVATHHPYDTPPGYPAPLSGDSKLVRHRNAIHYSDRAVAALLEMLARKGLASDTIIAVTGDHGEAFGSPHPANWVHKDFLFEENVREFLVLHDPRWNLPGPVVSGRLCSNGDVMPTLLAYLRASEPVPGRNLFEEVWEPRPVYFHKNASPEQWGLRDGRWKFIAERGSDARELYDLADDPAEQHNLAAARPELVRQYAAQCENWFARSDAQYLALLENYKPLAGRHLQSADYRQPGPKLQTIVVIDEFRDEMLYESTSISPEQRVAAWTAWVPDGKPHRPRWIWTGPSGGKWWIDTELAEAAVAKAWFPGKLPMEEGNWTVQLWHDGRPSLTTRFTVRGGPAGRIR